MKACARDCSRALALADHLSASSTDDVRSRRERALGVAVDVDGVTIDATIYGDGDILIYADVLLSYTPTDSTFGACDTTLFAEAHADLAGASSAIIVRVSAEKGRMLCARVDIPAGALLIHEEAYIAIHAQALGVFFCFLIFLK